MSAARYLFFVASLLPIAAPALADTYGRLEHVQVVGTAIEVVAKLDSGAARSALHAVNVKYFERDGDTWVRFTVDNGSVLPGNRVTLERPVLKDVKIIRQKGGGIEHRPLVEVELCLGDRRFTSKLNLSDRSGYTAPLAIGTSELAQIGSVDTARQFMHEPGCRTSGPVQAFDGKKAPLPVVVATAKAAPFVAPSSFVSSPPASPFACDGRTRCSQMTSCDEAKFFLNHCPTVQMDGDGDGIPCEEQFCGH